MRKIGISPFKNFHILFRMMAVITNFGKKIHLIMHERKLKIKDGNVSRHFLNFIVPLHYI